MKKIVAVLLSLLLSTLVIVYVAIPNPVAGNSTAYLAGSNSAVNRTLLNKQYWKKLWPNSKLTDSIYFTNTDSLVFQNGIILITKQFQNGFDCTIFKNNDSAKAHFSVMPRSRDSIVLHWQYIIPVSSNPVTRIHEYYLAKPLIKFMDNAMISIRNSLTEETLYGLTIDETSTKDTLLISTSTVTVDTPSVKNIYDLVRTLQQYAAMNDARQTDSAIVNITATENESFKTMVAIPVDKRLAGNSTINFKLMIPGKFLTTTVKGGSGTIHNAMSQMQLYFADYQRTAMAIPYERLITNREQQPDTGQWLTRIYFPVM